MAEEIKRYCGKVKNNFIFVQDVNQIFAVGSATDDYLKKHGVEYVPYRTRWTESFINQIISFVDSLQSEV